MKKNDLLSDKAEVFINHEAIYDTLKYAQRHGANRAIIESILSKAEAMEGITANDAALLLFNKDSNVTKRIFDLAARITDAYYGNRKVFFAPIYVSNFCINGCTYCPFHVQNKMPRKRMEKNELIAEVIALQDMGHKRLALEAGEHPIKNPLSYILECMETIYSVHHKSGSIRRLNVNIAAMSEEEYKRLLEIELGTYILFQETYNRKDYELLHPSGPKSDYIWHTEAMDRAMQAGIKDVGLGVLFGLHNYAFEFVALLRHAKHLEWCYGSGPHTVSVPRLQPAEGINLKDFPNALPDNIFLKIIALLRIALPYTGLIMSTRENENIRRQALKIGISQISGGSKTSVGGYHNKDGEQTDTPQFEVADTRTLDEVVRWVMELGYIPSFCTACYEKGRQGEEFMKICKKKQIHQFCTRNAMLSLAEYLKNYASEATREIGTKLLEAEKNRFSESDKLHLCGRIAKAEQGDVIYY